jgi:flagellar hook-basal body complex protein FliE
MIQGIGQNGLAQAALEAALRSVSQRGAKIDEALAQGLEGAPELARGAAAGPSFDKALLEGLSQADGAVKSAEALPVELLAGKVADFHEVAGRLKQSELVFKFSLEVRNKLIDAYRETMRMSV